ncbi:DUF3679 domain-containing protein [Caldalkalibacillus salinus]|uniref:DUF3679 domain-containing protein n=1 Tax=Caldalkalibacillus salinus TaxID=2803787 RepID=UPI0019232311|nr:DUF3679 domain-containing protein [Caldalkalibacillus salinus]
MAKFIVKVLLLISTLLFGLLLGMHQAEHGIMTLEGFTLERVVEGASEENMYIKQVDEDHVEMEEMAAEEEAFSMEDIEEKKAKWQERQNANKLSHLGTVIGEVVYSVSRKGAEWLILKLEDLL